MVFFKDVNQISLIQTIVTNGNIRVSKKNLLIKPKRMKSRYRYVRRSRPDKKERGRDYISRARKFGTTRFFLI